MFPSEDYIGLKFKLLFITYIKKPDETIEKIELE